MTSSVATLTPHQIRVQAAKHGDLQSYAKAVHNRELEPYQLAWAEALDTEDRTGFVCPPDTYKSTTVQYWVEQAIGRNHNIRILWLMNAGEQSEKRVMAIQSTIMSNNVYKDAFHVEPDPEKQWTKTAFFIKRDHLEGDDDADPTLMGCGLNGPYQGLHFDLIIIDDPTNQEDVRSPATMELQVAKIRGVVIDRLVEGGRIIFILTRWGENDLVPTFESMDFRVVLFPVLGEYPWGPTISPRRFPLERMEILRRDKGDALFELTYMGNAQALSSAISKMREHIRYWDDHDLPENPLDVFMGVDPAASLKTVSDPSAICTVGLDVRTKRKYVLECFAHRWEVPDLEREIGTRASRTAGLRAVGVETVAFQLSLVQYLKRNWRLPIRELPYRSRRQATYRMVGIDKDKVSRAMWLDSEFSRGLLYIPNPSNRRIALPSFEGVSFETEICSVPFGVHDDRMDATVFAAGLANAMTPQRRELRLRAR